MEKVSIAQKYKTQLTGVTLAWIVMSKRGLNVSINFWSNYD